MYSEHDMKEFFQNIVDQVATLSTQASKVQGLEQRIIELSQRFDELVETNRQLNVQLNETASKLNETQNMLSTTQSMLEAERAVTQALRETIIQRDAGVVQLEQSFRQEQDAHKITTSERDDARHKVQELEHELETHKTWLVETQVDRDHWRGKTSELESENAKLRQQLEKINSVLNPLRVVSADVA